jgi:hypothetical protein
MDLTPLNRKSFYGKAKAITDGDITYLKSYDTIVAEYNNVTRKMKIYDWYSAINSFLDYYGYPTMSKSEILDMKNKEFSKGGELNSLSQIDVHKKGGKVEIDEEFGELYNAFAEKDSKTGKGISAGFVFDTINGEVFGEEEDALAFAKKHGYKDLQESYDDEFHYWTEWYQDTPEDNGGYYTEDGKWIEVKKKGGKAGREIVHVKNDSNHKGKFMLTWGDEIIEDNFNSWKEAKAWAINKGYLVGKDEFKTGGKTGSFTYENVRDLLNDKIGEAVEEVDFRYEIPEWRMDEVEHKSRDGFIAWTDGGVEATGFAYGRYLIGSGVGLPTNTLDAQLAKWDDDAHDHAVEWFSEEYPEIFSQLTIQTEENLSYGLLYENGMGDLAEELDQARDEYLEEDSIMFQIGAYYYRPENDRGKDGKHTIYLYGVVNMEAPYHRKGNFEDYKDLYITFDSISELETKLDQSIPKIVGFLNGENYKEGKELKFKRW